MYIYKAKYVGPMAEGVTVPGVEGVFAKDKWATVKTEKEYELLRAMPSNIMQVMKRKVRKR